MKVTTEGLTIGVIAGLVAKGYKVEIEDGEQYANITKEAPLSPSVSIPEVGGYGGMG